MVGDAVEQRAGEALAGEDRGPFLEGQVGGDNGGAILVAPTEDVEEQFASALREGHVAELVDDQQADLGELVLEAEQSLLVVRLDHLVDQVGGGGEAHGEALLPFIDFHAVQEAIQRPREAGIVKPPYVGVGKHLDRPAWPVPAGSAGSHNPARRKSCAT